MNKEKQIMVNSKISHGMKKYTSKIVKIILYIMIAVLVGFTAVYAIDKLTPPGPASNTMYSLYDIWNLAKNGTPASEGSGTIPATPDIVSSSVNIPTLTEVYSAVLALTQAPASGAPTFASANVSSYQCSWFTDMTDPSDVRETPITFEGICTSNPGCSWDTTTPETPFCAGGTVTSESLGKNTGDPLYMTWYAAKKACALSTEGEQIAGTWRLPTNVELLTHYMNNNDAGNPPTGFVDGSYWSGATFQYSDSSDSAYGVYMSFGSVYYDSKSSPGYLGRCAH